MKQKSKAIAGPISGLCRQLIQALKFCQTMNPVIMLDEVDKMGRSYHGDPASALLEVLDPAKCRIFGPLSGCPMQSIRHLIYRYSQCFGYDSRPLKDRMDILRLSGYIIQEKIQIAKKYLTPRTRKAMGFKATQVISPMMPCGPSSTAMPEKLGCAISKVRLKKSCARSRLKWCANKNPTEKKKTVTKPHMSSYRMTPSNLDEYLGKPIFTTDRFYERTSIGSAWDLPGLPGGATLYIEAIQTPSDKIP